MWCNSVDSVKQALDPRVMDNAHICQLHYKTAWVHDERPNFYKSICVVLQMLDKEPPLAQMWVETGGCKVQVAGCRWRIAGGGSLRCLRTIAATYACSLRFFSYLYVPLHL